MISHVFYHQETVDTLCAVNSWVSIRDWFAPEDEVIILDVGCSLTTDLKITRTPAILRIERLPTTRPEERSYTHGLNHIMPTAKGDWVCLWRSDYIYHERYFPAVLAGMNQGSAVQPYEAFIGAHYCSSRWCRRRLEWLRSAPEKAILTHATVCPVYEVRDFAHFALRKDLWLASGGMDKRLWGYNVQFPELFLRLESLPDYHPIVSESMIAFHQTHSGSFTNRLLTGDQLQELQGADIRLAAMLGGMEAVADYKASTRRPPLHPRRPAIHYQAKLKLSDIWMHRLKTSRHLRAWLGREPLNE